MTAASFDEKLAAWNAWCEAPWGRLRFAVVEHTLRRETRLLGSGLRVLDVGGGDGRDAIPLARAGHHVTVLDPAPSWLAEARRRAEAAGVADRIATVEGSLDDLDVVGAGWDLVVCHAVLHYRPADAVDMGRLAALLRAGGRLSLLAPNPAARVVMTLTREGPHAALAALRSDRFTSVTLGTSGRHFSAEQCEAELTAAGLVVVGRYGARVANDYVTDDGLKQDPDYFAALLELELELCDREPFLRLGGLWQRVAERPSGAP